MKIEKNRVVCFHYSVSEQEGGAISETSKGKSPLTVLMGHGNLIAGLETAMLGKQAGEHFTVRLEAHEACGEHRQEWVRFVPKSLFGDAVLEAGHYVELKMPAGSRMVKICQVADTMVEVDLNHPLVGKALYFDVDIVDVREATPAEIQCKHIHPHVSDKGACGAEPS